MSFRFHFDQLVRFADTDAQGHVFFANYLTYFDEAYSAYMRAIGCPWTALVEQEGADIVYVDSHVQHRGRAFFEDTLRVHARIARIGTTSITAEFRAEKNDEVVAEGTLVSVCIDPKTKRKRAVPERLRAAVQQFEGGAA